MNHAASRAKEIFLDALNHDQGDSRNQFLDDSCGMDAELRHRVDRLIAAHELPDSILDRTESRFQADAIELAGQSIGPYKILQKIGEGGMGTVYMAEQKHPVKRRVAIKIIKAGMNTKQVLARFEAERQALAMMDHPNIAKVLEAGMTENGLPYFVMELVKGVSVTEFCDQNQLPTHERLTLFVDVCRAVQHAHQRGVIHRDLKPSNVLIAKYDDRPVAKVIDFGVAKATNQELTDRTMFTQFGQVVGTIEYMSPEQAHFNQLDIDTRSDVYSLGVMLYELLVGVPPFDRERLRSRALDEVMRIIRDEEPPRPSLKISTLGETADAVSARRQLSKTALEKSMRGDVDVIVMKSLEKDRSRRYESASAFAADIERYLNGHAIEARPASTGYRVRKFVTRNKSWVGACSAICLGMVLAFAGLLFGLNNTQRALAERDATLRKLVDEITGRAVSLALVGQSKQSRHAIDEARVAGADDSLILALTGLTHLYDDNNDYESAIDTFEDALKLDPNSFPAASGLWLAYDQIGDYPAMSPARARVEQLTPKSDTDRLFLAQIQRHVDPAGTQRLLVDLLDRHPFWGAAYAMLGRSRTELAKRRYQEDSALTLFEEAHNDFQRARILAPGSQFVLTDYLMSVMEAHALAKHRGFSDKAQILMELASELNEKIDSDLDTHGYSFRGRAWFFVENGEFDTLTELSRSMADREDALTWVAAADRFAMGQMEDLQNILDEDRDGGRYLQAIRMIHAAETEGVASARAIYDRTFGSSDTEVTDHDFVALPCLLLLGETAPVSNSARRMLENTSLINATSAEPILAYLSDPTPNSERTLVEWMGPFPHEQHYGHFCIGMVALANGDREKARKHFDIVQETGVLDSWFYVWANAFRKRLGEPDWPAWIEKN